LESLRFHMLEDTGDLYISRSYSNQRRSSTRGEMELRSLLQRTEVLGGSLDGQGGNAADNCERRSRCRACYFEGLSWPLEAHAIPLGDDGRRALLGCHMMSEVFVIGFWKCRALRFLNRTTNLPLHESCRACGRWSSVLTLVECVVFLERCTDVGRRVGPVITILRIDAKQTHQDMGLRPL
jgi:hypothetical protein